MQELQGAVRVQLSWCATVPNLAESAGRGFCRDKPLVLPESQLQEGLHRLQAACWVPRWGAGAPMILLVQIGKQKLA